jgi:hypothetical protein
MLAEYIGIAQLNDLITHRSESIFHLCATDLGRLRQVLVEDDSTARTELTVRLKFKPGLGAAPAATDGIPSVEVLVEGELMLDCQRCLGVMHWQSDIKVLYGLQLPGYGKNSEADLFETLEVGVEGFPLRELVEDELISGLPLVPKHIDESLCSSLMVAEIERPAVMKHEEMYQPFAGLVDLLSKDDSK